MPTPKQEYVNAVFNKTIWQFKKWQTYRIWENLAKYWKRYVEVVTTKTEKKKDSEKKWAPKKAKNKAVLSPKDTK